MGSDDKALNKKASELYHAGKYDEAFTMYNSALYIMKKRLGPKHTNIGDMLWNIANVYEKQGNYAAAASMLIECMEIYTEGYGEDHSETKAARKRALKLAALVD